MKWITSGILLVALITTAQAAPAPFADEDSLRLPKSSIPISYDITLTTNVHTGARGFSGIEKIEIEIVELSDFVTLHNRGLSVSSVKLISESGNELEIAISEDREKEFFIIESLVVTLQPGARYTVEIEFSGFLQGGTSGFYRSSYKVGVETRLVRAISFICKYISLWQFSCDKGTWLQLSLSLQMLVLLSSALMSPSSKRLSS